jgi:hypothetical protein
MADAFLTFVQQGQALPPTEMSEAAGIVAEIKRKALEPDRLCNLFCYEMRYSVILPVSFCILYLCACQNSLSRNIAPLVPKSDTSTIEKKNTLFAFVGEKVDVQPLPVDPGSMDDGFRAKYKILLPVYGSYSGETIEFIAYDHYGWPAFASFKNVLLFLSEYKGKYYHEKYQFFDVYRTKNGRWASPNKAGDYNHLYNKNTSTKPEIVEFAETVKYPLLF